MCTWVEKVYERESGELRRTVAQCLDGQAPIVQKTRCPQIAENLEKHPGLAAALTWTLEETLGVCSMVMDRVQTGGARPTFNVTVGLLSFARPGELLRMRPCDLVPPLRGALQNFSVVLAAGETGRPTKVRTFNDTLELNDPLARNLVSFWEALRGQGSKKTVVALHLSNFLPIVHKEITDLTLPPIVPHPMGDIVGRQSIQQTAPRTLEQVKMRGRWQVMQTVQRCERHSR